MEGTVNKSYTRPRKKECSTRMLRFVKSSLRRLLERQRTGARAPKGTVSGCRTVRHTRLLESEDHTDQLFGSMGNGYIVVFTLSLLFGKIASER